jgi:hypothetical protein
MNREPYRDNPFQWGRAQRHMHDWRYACPIEVGRRSLWLRLLAWFARFLT